jgi:hypothetical protein
LCTLSFNPSAVIFVAIDGESCAHDCGGRLRTGERSRAGTADQPGNGCRRRHRRDHSGPSHESARPGCREQAEVQSKQDDALTKKWSVLEHRGEPTEASQRARHVKLQLMIDDRAHVADDPPPILGSWRNVYIAILIYLVVIITSFYIFTRAFS